jgi:cytoplasmic iron level regulating protein YaaA (DUF328/UPF0246 family)
MLVLLSPAKSLDWSPAPGVSTTAPRLGDDIGVLMNVTRRLSEQKLKQLMGISDDLAALNHERFQAMSGDPDGETARPAALAFNGDVYQGLDARSLSPDQLAWAQDHVAILSGLYGVLRPLDAIEPYRLEMGTRLKTRRGGSLYDFWGDRVTRVLNQQLADRDAPVVVNLASNEYWRVVKTKTLKAPVVTPVFWEEWDGKQRPISFYAKRARGAMARWIVTERIEDPADLRGYDGDGYKLFEEKSSDDRLVFMRLKPPPMNG